MRIDLPITIIFDCHDARFEHGAGKQVMTLRYDTDGNGSDAELFPSYPPTMDHGELASGIIAWLDRRIDKKITDRATRNPAEYMVGTDEERATAQQEIISDDEKDAWS